MPIISIKNWFMTCRQYSPDPFHLHCFSFGLHQTMHHQSVHLLHPWNQLKFSRLFRDWTHKASEQKIGMSDHCTDFGNCTAISIAPKSLPSLKLTASLPLKMDARGRILSFLDGANWQVLCLVLVRVGKTDPSLFDPEEFSLSFQAA